MTEFTRAYGFLQHLIKIITSIKHKTLHISLTEKMNLRNFYYYIYFLSTGHFFKEKKIRNEHLLL